MVKISVVIPVYNVENYLSDCLDSIINQTFEDIEIICINDGSTDKSLDILNAYAKNDERISVYSQENGGHAVATNRGMDLATGDYLFLMDSDDILDLKALELSYEKAIEMDVDFVLFKVLNYDDTNDRYYETEVYSMDQLANLVGEDIFDYHKMGKLMFKTCVTPWSKLYKRDFIMEHNIRFPEGLIFEDNVFFFNAVLNAKKIYFLKEFLFIRRWYDTSSTTNGDLRFLDSIDVYNLIIDLFKEHGEFENYKENLYNNKISLAFMRYNNIREEYKETFFKAMKEDFLKLLDKDKYQTFIDSLIYRNRKIFEHVIISENSIELNLLRRIYDKQMQSYSYMDSIMNQINKVFIQNSIDHYNTLDYSNKDNYFNVMRERFILLISNGIFYSNNLKYHYKKIFEQIIISNNHDEFKHIRNIYDVQMKNYYLMDNISFNEKNLNKSKKLNQELISSNSWKYTKYLRDLKN